MPSLVEAIPGLQSILRLFTEERRHREDRDDAAVASLYAAANETGVYLARLERGGQRDRQVEEELSRLWSRAAVALRRTNADLADRSLTKSEIWLQPERWSAEEIKRARVGIAQVYRDARQLLVS